MTQRREGLADLAKVFSVPNLRTAFYTQNFHQSRFQNTLKELGILEKRFFQENEKAFLFELKRVMEAGEYHPDEPLPYRVPKSVGSHRVITRLSLSDSILYQSIFSKHWLGKIIDKKLSSDVYGNRVNFSKKSKGYLKNYKEQRNAFIDYQQKAIKESYHWRLEVDVSNYYPSISHKHLFRILRSHFNSYPNLLDLLEQQLSHWFPEGRGIPQGHEGSAVLANAFLYPLDKTFAKLKGRYVRYGDDMIFMFKTPEDASICADKISRLLLDLGLQTNSKTNLKFYSTSDELDVLHLASDYLYLDGEKFNLVEVQQLIETSSSLKDYFEKIQNFQSLDKHELTQLKFFLRSGGVFTEDHFDEITRAFFYSSELAFYNAAYLSQYIDEDRQLFQSFLNLYKKHYEKLSPWQKYNGAALLLSSPEIKKRHRLQTLSKLTTGEDIWEIAFISLVMSLSDSENPDEICARYKNKFGDSRYIIFLCSAVFNNNYCSILFSRGVSEKGTFAHILHSITVGSAVSLTRSEEKKSSRSIESGIVADITEIKEKVFSTFDIVKAIHEQRYKPKAIFAIENDSRESFRVSCLGDTNEFVFYKKEKWTHLCFLLIKRHEKGHAAAVLHDDLISYLQEQHKEYNFEHPPLYDSRIKIRSAVRELIKSANNNFYKCAPELLLKKKLFEQKEGSVTLLLKGLKG